MAATPEQSSGHHPTHAATSPRLTSPDVAAQRPARKAASTEKTVA